MGKIHAGVKLLLNLCSHLFTFLFVGLLCYEYHVLFKIFKTLYWGCVDDSVS